MKIEKAVLADIDEIMLIYKKAQEFMAQNDNPDQWENIWPPKELVKDNISKGIGYKCLQNNEIVGVFFMRRV